MIRYTVDEFFFSTETESQKIDIVHLSRLIWSSNNRCTLYPSSETRITRSGSSIHRIILTIEQQMFLTWAMIFQTRARNHTKQKQMFKNKPPQESGQRLSCETSEKVLVTGIIQATEWKTQKETGSAFQMKL